MPLVAAFRSVCLGTLLALLASAALADGPGRAAIASPHGEATAAARQILAQGGNAFDAAIAISADAHEWSLLRWQENHKPAVLVSEMASASEIRERLILVRPH